MDGQWGGLTGRRRLRACPTKPFGSVWVLMMLAPAAHAVIVDRVAVSVGEKIITQSEIEQRIRLTAFENRENANFDLSDRQRAVAKLVDEKLIEKEMDVGRYPRNDEQHKKELLASFEETEYKGDSTALGRALAGVRLSRQDLADDLGRQSDLLTFLELRFRPAVQVTDEDIRKYFDANVKGAALGDVRDEIEQKLTMDRADKELDLWLADQKKRTRIEYLEKDLEPAKQ